MTSRFQQTGSSSTDGGEVGSGHNLPQEAPQAFAEAMCIDADSYR